MGIRGVYNEFTAGLVVTVLLAFLCTCTVNCCGSSYVRAKKVSNSGSCMSGLMQSFFGAAMPLLFSVGVLVAFLWGWPRVVAAVSDAGASDLCKAILKSTLDMDSPDYTIYNPTCKAVGGSAAYAVAAEAAAVPAASLEPAAPPVAV
jgi:hypothetical protein